MNGQKQESQEAEEKKKIAAVGQDTDEMEPLPPSYDMACTCTGLKASVPVLLMTRPPQVSLYIIPPNSLCT